ncbi:hypothetical protein J2857_003951 [Neorhizobium galegae]|uniref:type II toxin-antitoxin system VapC family toxin n=1 Tax=Neorhizobium galegae TaxID=399 RepID=UPI001AEA896C|nr:type II toxin-antitoxin system VapC family toxin [Neorhizobium galegae]MBP2561161.1 hypothetical protein [Neorhizobium galegae]
MTGSQRKSGQNIRRLAGKTTRCQGRRETELDRVLCSGNGTPLLFKGKDFSQTDIRAAEENER